MNILLTNRCNRKCPYCFAQERISFDAKTAERRAAPTFISEADFDTAIDFLSRSGVDRVGLLGGEPSLHPQFPTLLERAMDAGVHPKVFTNGLWSTQTLDAVSALDDGTDDRFNLVVNVNEPERTGEAEQRRQHRTLARLGRRSSLSFNISRPSFDPSFLVELIETYETHRYIRLGVAEPLAQMENEHLDVADYPQMAPSLMALADLADRADIHLGFDCGFTLCMFTEAELGRLVMAGARFRSVCGPAVDIGTDLSAWACFPLSTFAAGELITEFADADALVAHFNRRFEPLFKTGALPECAGCRHRKRGQCSGGCAAHVYRKVNPT